MPERSAIGDVDAAVGDLARDGFRLQPKRLSETSVTALQGVIDGVGPEQWEARSDGTRFAIRNAHLVIGQLLTAVEQAGLIDLAREVLGARVAPVSATIFDKPEGAKWYVPAHQDVVHPLGGVVPSGADFRTPTLREGILYAGLPESLLREMLAIRVHLDQCLEAGALEVMPASHVRLLRDSEVKELPAAGFVACPGAAGSLLLMRPLLVHRSRRSASGVRRRVLHLVFAGKELPRGLTWTWQFA